MKWELGSIQEYVQAKEYIDTAIIPLVTIEAGENSISSARQVQYIVNLANQIEGQIRGRAMLFPVLSIVPRYTDEQLTELLNEYVKQLQQDGFKNVVFLTQKSWLEQRQVNVSGDILRVQDSEAQSVDDLKGDILKEAKRLTQTFIQIWNR
ncbi:DUF2487 family protein [Bacillus horti]|uniref:DUF2487 family protein n=1 Tax=Caldalkalibacillus horti TaxID=77523 RepID=A0ABT9VWW5_9BACI|nr:DUF2487 family protein [Bacillus horti]MDQ0165489.1 hypothetical protein [Bacillus horti]